MRNIFLLALLLSVFSFAQSYGADAVEPGLWGEYFDIGGNVDNFPEIPADKKPKVARVDKQLYFESVDDHFAGTDLSLNFYARWTGVLRVPKDGKYTLYTVSDDGSRVFLDGKQIVDNGGLHAMEEKDSGPLDLKAGDHEIKIEFFQAEGGAGCQLLWSTADAPKAAIPDTALFHKALPAAAPEAKPAPKKDDSKPADATTKK